jgi:hypothetical protein
MSYPEMNSIPSMCKTCSKGVLFVALLVPMSNATAADFYKCTINGSITYQGEPCPTSEPPVKRPTVEQLNAERQKKLREMGANASSAPASAPRTGDGLMSPKPNSAPAAWPSLPPVAPVRQVVVPNRAPAAVSTFRCDGRKYCSQMTSCAEAEYFLANCPGVKMDGNGHGNGVPCERQWCGRDADEQLSGRRRN